MLRLKMIPELHRKNGVDPSYSLWLFGFFLLMFSVHQPIIIIAETRNNWTHYNPSCPNRPRKSGFEYPCLLLVTNYSCVTHRSQLGINNIQSWLTAVGDRGSKNTHGEQKRTSYSSSN